MLSMITADMGLYIFLAGFLSILVLRFYRGKYWYIFLILGFSLIGLGFVMDNVTILTGNNEKHEYLTLKNSHFYTFENGTTKTISIEDNTLINDTENEFIIEKVEYGYSKYSSSDSRDNFMTTISPYSAQSLTYSIDYFYTEPPQSIRVKGGSSKTRYWLHK